MDKKAFSFRGLNSPHDPPTRGSAPGPRSGLCSARSPCPLPLSKSWIPPLWGACSIVLDVVYEEKKIKKTLCRINAFISHTHVHYQKNACYKLEDNIYNC